MADERTIPRGPRWAPTLPPGVPTDPQGPLGEPSGFDLRRWDPGVPMLLMPVRLETKYATGTSGDELRIRVLPDPISIASAAPASAAELDEGTGFWTAYHRATGPDQRAAVWRQFVGRVGTTRAGYIARLTRPVAGADGRLTFPAVATELPTPGVMALLPECWLALGWVGETLAFEQLGEPIAGPLAVSPDPAAPVTEAGESQLRIDPATSWLFDYNEAVARGMAITVPLTGIAAKAADGVSTLLVVGIDPAQTTAATADQLADLFDDHSRAAGLAFVPQGTPTNNTATVAAGYRRDEAELADLEQRALGVSRPAGDDNASRLVRLLGLADVDTFERLAFGADLEFARSRDMRVALFETVIGTYLRDLLATHAVEDDRLSAPIASSAIDSLREWFRSWVTGGAPVPAIRVGDQPYGILPVMPAKPAAPLSGVAAWITGVVDLLREEWRSAVAAVPVLDHDATDSLGATPEEASAVARDLVARVLSNNPHPRRISLRSATDWSDQPEPELPAARRAARTASTRPLADVLVGSNEWSYPVAMALTGGFRWEFRDALADVHGGFASTLGHVYDAVLQEVVPGRPDIDTVPAPRLVPTGPATEEDIRGIEQQLEVWTQTDVAIHEPGAVFHHLPNIVEILHEFCQDVIEQLERHELRQRPLRWLDVPGLDGVLGRDDLQLLLTKFGATERIVRRELVVEDEPVAGISAAGYLDALSAATAGRPGDRTGPGPIGTERTGPDLPGGGLPGGGLPGGGLPLPGGEVPPLLPPAFVADPPLLYQLVDATRTVADNPSELAAALGRLADVAPDDLDWLVRETLGLGGHRLDAWHTGFASQRLAAMRERSPHGLYAGHYGVALDLVRAEGRPSQGFLHAPSLAHAGSAAVLRSGWLARGSGAAGSPAAIDLASARVRDAEWLLSGVRQGQDLGDLLGASFERSLHDARLDVAIRPLRQAVADANGLGDAALDVPVDGILLLDLHRVDGLTAAIDGLDLGSVQQQALVARLAAIEASFDAIDDLTTFESVHHLVVGNLERAAAVLDSSGPNGGRPPASTGVRTPRGATTVDVRALVLIAHDADTPSGWRAGTRDRFDPALESWAASMLPPPGEVGWRAAGADGGPVELRLDELAVSALDACSLASDDPTTLTAGLRRLAELARPEATLVGHDPSDPGGAPISLAEWQLLAVELRRLIHESAPADERAVRPSDDSLVPVDDPAGVQVAVEDGLAALTSALDTARRAEDWSRLPVDVAEALARIGLVPSAAGATVDDFAETTARIERRRTAADAITDTGTWDGMRRRVAALTGIAVPLLAPFVLPADGGIVLAKDLATPDAIDDWLDIAASVHPNLGHLARLIDLAGWLGQPPPTLVAGQAPLLAGDAWAAIAAPSPGTGGRVAATVLTHGAVAPGRSVVGLVVDRWPERIPSDDQMTGVAFHFDGPSAEAPQTMLLAVPPEGAAWSTDLVVDAILETIEWMQLRAVALDDLGDYGHALPTTFVPGSLDGAEIVGAAS
jgi:hypothetical protein